MDYSPPGSSVHGIIQARILEWCAVSFSRNVPTQESNQHLLHWQEDSLQLSHLGNPKTAGLGKKKSVEMNFSYLFCGTQSSQSMIMWAHVDIIIPN